MKLKFLIPFLLFALSSFAQSRPKTLRADEADNSANGYPRLNGSAKLPTSVIDTTVLATRAYAQSQGGGSGESVGTVSGDVISWSAAALLIYPNNTDMTAQLQAAVNNSNYNVIWFNNPAGGAYRIDGYVTVPYGKMIRMEPGNILSTSVQSSAGTFTAAQYSRTVTGSGTFFTTTMRPGYKLAYTGIAGVVKTGGGSGYNLSSPPTYTVTGGGGTGATVQAVLSSDGTMSGWRLLTPGYGYTSNPTLTRTDGGSGSGATGTISLAPVIFGVVESIQSNTSLTLRNPVKYALNSVALSYYGGVISGGIMSASLQQQICTSAFTLDMYSTDFQNCVNWYGAKPNDGLDDYLAMQKAIDDATWYGKIGTVRVGLGTYDSNKGLLFRVGNDAYASTPYCPTNFIGAGTFYDANLGGGSKIVIHSLTGWGVNFQRCRGNIVKDIELEGQNLISYGDATEAFSDTATYVMPGISDNHYAPYVGWAIDYCATPGSPVQNRAPDFPEMWTEANQSGSSLMTFQNLATRRFVINYCNSLLQQNGEDMTFYNCKSTESKVAFGVYTSQAINCRVIHSEIWGKTKFAFDAAFPDNTPSGDDGNGYGQGGQMFEVSDANLQNVKWVLRVAASANTSRLDHVRCEVVYGVGGSFSGTTGYAETRLIADNWWANWAGINPEGSQAVCPQYMGQFQDINFTNCVMGQFERPGNPYNFKAASIYFNGTKTYMLGKGGQLYHTMTRWQGGSGDRFNGTGNGDGRGTDVALSSAVNVTSIDRATGTWKYTLNNSGDLVGTISVGDRVDVFSNALVNEFHYGSASIIPIGEVAAYNTSTREVTVRYLAFGIVPGLLLNTVYIRH